MRRSRSMADTRDPWARGCCRAGVVPGRGAGTDGNRRQGGAERLSDAPRRAVERLGVLSGEEPARGGADLGGRWCWPACRTPQDPAIQARIKEAQRLCRPDARRPQGRRGHEAARGDGARREEVERDEAAHRYHNYEYAVGALEIAIVLASVSVVTRMRALTYGAAAIGGIAAIGAIGVATNLF